MVYLIKLHPDYPYAFYENGGWYCPDPKAIPMLDYFTKEVRKAHPEYSEEEMVRAVAASIVGCEFIWARPVSSFAVAN
jgi:hypothetical protein